VWSGKPEEGGMARDKRALHHQERAAQLGYHRVSRGWNCFSSRKRNGKSTYEVVKFVI